MSSEVEDVCDFVLPAANPDRYMGGSVGVRSDTWGHLPAHLVNMVAPPVTVIALPRRLPDPPPHAALRQRQ